MEWTTTDIVYISFETIVGFLTVVGNTIVLIAIIRTHKLHTVTNVFVGNLAVADILVGLIVAPLAALSFLGLPKHKYGCIFINSAILMLTNISILMLLAVAVERFIAIRLPYVYNRLLTARRAFVVNGLIWILGSLLGLIPMFGWNKAPDKLKRCAFTSVIYMEYMVYFQFSGLVLVPLVIMFCIYTYILLVIRKHAKRSNQLTAMFSPNEENSRKARKKWRKEVRAAKSFALIIFLFAIFWLPVNILNTITLLCSTCNFPIELLLSAIVLSHANSSINPFLYAASNSRIFTSIKQMFCCREHPEDALKSRDFSSGTKLYETNKKSVPNITRNIRNTSFNGETVNKPIHTITGSINIQNIQNTSNIISPLPTISQGLKMDGVIRVSPSIDEEMHKSTKKSDENFITATECSSYKSNNYFVNDSDASVEHYDQSANDDYVSVNRIKERHLHDQFLSVEPDKNEGNSASIEYSDSVKYKTTHDLNNQNSLKNTLSDTPLQNGDHTFSKDYSIFSATSPNSWDGSISIAQGRVNVGFIGDTPNMIDASISISNSYLSLTKSLQEEENKGKEEKGKTNEEENNKGDDELIELQNYQETDNTKNNLYATRDDSFHRENTNSSMQCGIGNSPHMFSMEDEPGDEQQQWGRIVFVLGDDTNDESTTDICKDDGNTNNKTVRQQVSSTTTTTITNPNTNIQSTLNHSINSYQCHNTTLSSRGSNLTDVETSDSTNRTMDELNTKL